MKKINAKLWSAFQQSVQSNSIPMRMSGNRYSAAGGGPHGACVHGGANPACSGTSMFPTTKVAIRPQLFDDGSEQNPYVGIDAHKPKSTALTSKLKVWCRSVIISATGDVYMGANTLVFLVWLWQITRTDDGRPFFVEPGWVTYPYIHTGVCEWVQTVLRTAWPPQSSSPLTMVTVATKERADLTVNGGGRHCREELPFRGLKLTDILKDSPIEMQVWLRDLVRDHPPPVAFAIAGLKVSRLSGLAGPRRDRTRAEAAAVGRIAIIDPLGGLVMGHGLQDGDSTLGSQNYEPMFKRIWRNMPGGLSERREAQFIDALDFPLRVAGNVGRMLLHIWRMGTVDTKSEKCVIPETRRFRRWLSSCWIPSLQGNRNSPCISIELSHTVYRSPPMADVLAAFERQDLRITLLPAVADRVSDAQALVRQAELPDGLSWLKRATHWFRPLDPVPSGRATVVVMATEANPLTWSDLRQYVVAEVPEVAIVLRPSRSIRWFVQTESACEYDLLRWMGVVDAEDRGDSVWHAAHVPLGTAPDWSDRDNKLPTGSQPTTCDYARARLAVSVCNALVGDHVDGAMRTTAPFTSNAAAATRERLELNGPAAKRARVYVEEGDSV
mgnify:CR=1 FL=1|tara:strand:- start:6331 stop:8163 length:1833 start_codon:yes stop_codon:yes gene_type:complete